MPNILAHTYITGEVLGSDNPNVVLGSTLPDFAAMYDDRKRDLDKYEPPRRRVIVRGFSKSIDAGISFHQRTDSVFNEQPEKPKITTPLAADLARVGVSEGAARLSADFIMKIVLDSGLLDNPQAIEEFAQLTNSIIKEDTLLGDGRLVDDFDSFVTDYFKHGAPVFYSDPDWIAKMAQQRLDSRARSRLLRETYTFVPELIPAVAEVIDTHASRAVNLGTVALNRTIDILKS